MQDPPTNGNLSEKGIQYWSAGFHLLPIRCQRRLVFAPSQGHCPALASSSSRLNGANISPRHHQRAPPHTQRPIFAKFGPDQAPNKHQRGGALHHQFQRGSKKKQTIEMRLEAEQNTLDRGISDIGRGLFDWNWIMGMLPNSSGEIKGGLSQMICSATVPNSSCPCRECNSLIDPISGNLIGNHVQHTFWITMITVSQEHTSYNLPYNNTTCKNAFESLLTFTPPPSDQ